MQKFVITYSYGDFYCSNEVNDCIEYESKEQLEFDLELAMEPMTSGAIDFHGLELEVNHFMHRDRIGNYHYNPPQIQTLEEWFESRKPKSNN